jgi:hypothetical protein
VGAYGTMSIYNIDITDDYLQIDFKSVDEFLKFEKKRDKVNISPDKKLLKYINKAIKQLNKIKILITNKDKKENLSLIQSRENLFNKNIRIDLSKIGKI